MSGEIRREYASYIEFNINDYVQDIELDPDCRRCSGTGLVVFFGKRKKETCHLCKGSKTVLTPFAKNLIKFLKDNKEKFLNE